MVVSFPIIERNLELQEAIHTALAQGYDTTEIYNIVKSQFPEYKLSRKTLDRYLSHILGKDQIDSRTVAITEKSIQNSLSESRKQINALFEELHGMKITGIQLTKLNKIQNQMLQNLFNIPVATEHYFTNDKLVQEQVKDRMLHFLDYLTGKQKEILSEILDECFSGDSKDSKKYRRYVKKCNKYYYQMFPVELEGEKH